jgi:RNA polymerase sigma-70 factor (ECF subfamily)
VGSETGRWPWVENQRQGRANAPMRALFWGFGPLDERMRRSPVVETLEPSDEALCGRVAQRNPEAFELLVERYQERAYRIAWSVVRDREDAKDCSQEAFIRLHESAGSFAGQAKFSTWFYRILVNCCLDHQRKRRGWRQMVGWGGRDEAREMGDPVERLAAPFTDPTDAMVADHRMSRLWEAVEDLSPQQRAAVMLQCREELSTKEIAVVLQLSEATVRVHLHRAYSALKRRVGGEG